MGLLTLLVILALLNKGNDSRNSGCALFIALVILALFYLASIVESLLKEQPPIHCWDIPQPEQCFDTL
jgi:hypothetical protein